MPIVAVVAGISGAAAGAAGAAALIGGAFTLANVAAGLAVVGGISTALGAVTGNKKLMKFGMVAGLGSAALGGIASLTSASTASSTALSAGDTGLGLSAKAAGEGLKASDTGLLGIGNKAAEVGGGGAFAPGVGRSLAAVNALDTGVAGLAGQAPTAPVAAAPSAALDLRTPAQAPAVPQLQQSGPAPQAGDTMSEASARLRFPSVAADTGAGAFGGFGQWLNNNKELAKTGTGILSGLGQGYMEKEKQAAVERAEELKRARINASIQGQRQAY